MNTRIPLHSLALCSTFAHLDAFPVHERLARRMIERDLIGEDSRLRIDHVIFDELRHRINLKLSLGERVAVFVGDLSATERQQLVLTADNQGASVTDVATSDPVQFAKPPLLDALRLNWRGVTVIGDIHGDHDALLAALAWARSRHHIAWLLGDIIDYGIAPLDCVATVYRAVMMGAAATILGNHERKIARWLDQRENGKATIRTSDGNKVTIAALERLISNQRRRWIGQFRGLLAHSSLLCQMTEVTLLHAAAHPSLWTGSPDADAVERFALYGEPDHDKHGAFRQSYRWVDRVPKGQTVYVGHDMLHDYPMVRTGKAGGEVVFLDTGAGKGGHLSSADLRFADTGLHLECFKRY